MGLSSELTVLVEENFLLISTAWSWWKETKNDADEVREQINSAQKNMSKVYRQGKNSSQPQSSSEETFIL